MTQRHTVPLQNLHTGQTVEAQLLDRVDLSFARQADDAWLKYVDTEQAARAVAGTMVARQEHLHWRWAPKVEVTLHLLSYPTLGIEYENQAQGLMMLCTDGEFSRLKDQRTLPVVYVPFLATAPWNLANFANKPRFRGVGTVLIRAAVETSFDLGFKGRIGLHSLPQSDSWYERLGMLSLGTDPDKQNLKYYEMTADKAAAFIR